MAEQNFTVDTGLTVTGTGGNITGANNIVAANSVSVSGNAGDITMTGGNITGFTALVGNTANVTLTANAVSWTFDTDGVLNVPGEGVIRSTDDTVTLLSFNTSTGNANSVYMGTSGGLGFSDTALTANWLEIFRNGADPEIAAPRGNLLLVAAQGQSGGAGKNVNITGGAADQLDYYTTAGGNVNIVGGLGASNDGGGGGPGGNVNLTTGLSADPAGVAGNVNITAGSGTLVFDYNGNLTASGDISGVILIATNASGDEGGEITLVKAPNSTLGGNLIIDAYRNQVRVFDGGGSTQGMYFDIANAPSSVGAAVGYRDIPQVSFTGNATLAATDAGKHYYSVLSTANTLTIANNTSVSWVVGTAISVVNRGTGNISIAQGSGVSLYLAGNATASNRTLTTYGMATIMNVAANVWMINGTGVS